MEGEGCTLQQYYYFFALLCMSKMCMLDPDEYPREKIQALYAAETDARKEVKEMFPEPERIGDILQQAGTSATWFVEPKNVRKNGGHFGGGGARDRLNVGGAGWE